MVAIPDNVSFSEAAATWVAYGTAWGGLVAIGALGAGQTVLIPAASSSVGLAAIHLKAGVGGMRPIVGGVLGVLALVLAFAKPTEPAGESGVDAQRFGV